MTRPVFTMALLSTILLACSDEPGICEGEIPPKTLDVFEPCDGPIGGPDDPCKVGLCIEGFCHEPCAEDDDCLFGGVCGPHSDGTNYCHLYCDEEPHTCPSANGRQLECISKTLCGLPNDCDP